METLPDSEFRAIVVEAARRLHARLVGYTSRFFRGESSRAEDVVQHAFLQLCRIAPDARPRQVDQWLFRVCRNRAIDHHRSKQRLTAERNGSMPDDLADTSVDHRDQVSDRELHQIVRRQIELLPDSQREAIDLWSYGFRYAEIANVMERPESTVRVLVHRGLTRLREDHTIAAAIGCESISRRAGTTTNTA